MDVYTCMHTHTQLMHNHKSTARDIYTLLHNHLCCTLKDQYTVLSLGRNLVTPEEKQTQSVTTKLDLRAGDIYIFNYTFCC